MPSISEILAGASRFQIACKTGAVAAGANTKIIFYARNASTTTQVFIERVKLNGHIATTAYAVGQVLYEMHVARGFSAENGTPTGTALTITGVNQRLRLAQASTALAVIRIADTTATGIVAPTWTLDANPIGQLNTHTSAGVAAATPIIGNQYLPNDGDLYNDTANEEYPIILGANEGIGIRVTVPATGVAIHGITMKWAEVAGINL